LNNLFDRALQAPEAIAVHDGMRTHTWAELLDRAHRVAHLLRDELGLRPDDHAAILMNNRVEYPEILLGALFAGIWITPVNWHLSQEEVRYILRDSGARALFADPYLADKVGASDVPCLTAGASLDDALAAVISAPLSLDDPVGGTMVYTSGTSGQPKGVRRFRPDTVRDAIAAWATVGEVFGLDGSGPHLLTGPMYHAAPGLYALYDLINGAPLIMMPRWDARTALDLMTAHAIRHTHMVPTMFVRLLRLPDEVRSAFDPSSLDLVLHGAAPCTPSVKRAMIDWWGRVLVEYWGASEGGAYTLIDSGQWLARPGSVGQAIRSLEVFAADEEGRKLPANQPGTLHCRHRTRPDVFEYHNAHDKTAAAFIEPGVFTVGDLGRVDPDGWVYLEGRRTDLILSGGVNVYPAEVQAVLAEHPAVSDVAVFGIPDPEWGERVHAVVELADNTEPTQALTQDLIDYTRTRLAHYKVPRKIELVDALPRNPTGKLRLDEIRRQYGQ
jgi:acyl-CoA synthetase (AMP-forming)/AMP-acid ligase II